MARLVLVHIISSGIDAEETVSRQPVQVCYMKHVRQLHMEGEVVHAAHLLGSYAPDTTLTMRKVDCLLCHLEALSTVVMLLAFLQALLFWVTVMVYQQRLSRQGSKY